MSSSEHRSSRRSFHAEKGASPSESDITDRLYMGETGIASSISSSRPRGVEEEVEDGEIVSAASKSRRRSRHEGRRRRRRSHKYDHDTSGHKSKSKSKSMTKQHEPSRGVTTTTTYKGQHQDAEDWRVDPAFMTRTVARTSGQGTFYDPRLEMWMTIAATRNVREIFRAKRNSGGGEISSSFRWKNGIADLRFGARKSWQPKEEEENTRENRSRSRRHRRSSRRDQYTDEGTFGQAYNDSGYHETRGTSSQSEENEGDQNEKGVMRTMDGPGSDDERYPRYSDEQQSGDLDPGDHDEVRYGRQTSHRRHRSHRRRSHRHKSRRQRSETGDQRRHHSRRDDEKDRSRGHRRRSRRHRGRSTSPVPTKGQETYPTDFATQKQDEVIVVEELESDPEMGQRDIHPMTFEEDGQTADMEDDEATTARNLKEEEWEADESDLTAELSRSNRSSYLDSRVPRVRTPRTRPSTGLSALFSCFQMFKAPRTSTRASTKGRRSRRSSSRKSGKRHRRSRHGHSRQRRHSRRIIEATAALDLGEKSTYGEETERHRRGRRRHRRHCT